MRDGRLEGVEAIVQRQQRVLSERHDDGLVLAMERTVDLGSRGPVSRSATEPRFCHFATVLGLMP